MPDQTAIAQPLDTLQPGLAKMGPKPTLQPLILADSSALDDPQPSAAESASQAAASPVESNPNSRSPKLQQRMSPFPISKFAVHRNRPNRTGTSPTLQPQPPRPATSTGPTDEASRQQQHQQLQMCRAQARDDSELPRPSRSNLDPSSAAMPIQGLRQAMTDGTTKPTKSSFFQFNKTPKTPGISHAAQYQQHLEARNQPTSRGDDKADKGQRGKAILIQGRLAHQSRRSSRNCWLEYGIVAVRRIRGAR